MSAISKSIVRAMNCRQLYASHYLLPDSRFRLIDSPLATVGSEVRSYRDKQRFPIHRRQAESCILLRDCGH
jgi:hypothetical protein